MHIFVIEDPAVLQRLASALHHAAEQRRPVRFGIDTDGFKVEADGCWTPGYGRPVNAAGR